jgi:catechol 2,3-dioxygenase-like lactoylglutathione lyase family enzyme
VVRRLHHTSRTVSNLERSLGFYRDLLGLELVADEELAGEGLARVVGVPGARLRVVELKIDEACLLELIEYHHPRGAPRLTSASAADVGAHHFALAVDDLDAIHERLSSAGIRFTTAPTTIPSGLFAGTRTTYCFDPDNLTVELVQPPA